VSGDLKHGLTSSRPRLSIIGRHAMTHLCRAMEYGADKYKRGNYHGNPPAGVGAEARVLGYVDAALRHLTEVSQLYNVAHGTDGDTRAAVAVTDDVASRGFPASGLPHLSHALASLMVAIECAVQDGLLPADPGQPWREGQPAIEERSPEATQRAVETAGTGNAVRVSPAAIRAWSAEMVARVAPPADEHGTRVIIERDALCVPRNRLCERPATCGKSGCQSLRETLQPAQPEDDGFVTVHPKP
jgi:hypothetical protein